MEICWGFWVPDQEMVRETVTYVTARVDPPDATALRTVTFVI